MVAGCGLDSTVSAIAGTTIFTSEAEELTFMGYDGGEDATVIALFDCELTVCGLPNSIVPTADNLLLASIR